MSNSNIISCADAKSQGLKRYYTGAACRNGHVADRLVSNKACVECKREREREYLRKRRAGSPEAREQARQYMRDYNRKRYAEDPEYRQYNRKRYREDPDFRDKQLEYKRSRRQDPDFLEAKREYDRTYARANPTKFAAHAAKRRAAKIQRTPAWADHELIEVFYALAREVSEETGIPHEVDHIAPLQGESVSGLHVATNLQILTASENRSKSNKSMGLDDAD